MHSMTKDGTFEELNPGEDGAKKDPPPVVAAVTMGIAVDDGDEDAVSQGVDKATGSSPRNPRVCVFARCVCTCVCV